MAKIIATGTVRLHMLRMQLQSASLAQAMLSGARRELVVTPRFDPLWHKTSALGADVAIEIDKLKREIAELEQRRESRPEADRGAGSVTTSG